MEFIQHKRNEVQVIVPPKHEADSYGIQYIERKGETVTVVRIGGERVECPRKFNRKDWERATVYTVVALTPASNVLFVEPFAPKPSDMIYPTTQKAAQ